MEDNKKEFSDEGAELYKEKNDAIITPDSYYENLPDVKRQDEEERYYEIFDNGKPKSLGWSIASIVLGIISVLYGFIGWIGIIIGAAAICFAVISRVRLGYFNTMSVAGLILGIFGMVFGISYLLFTVIFGPAGLLGGQGSDIQVPDINADKVPGSDI